MRKLGPHSRPGRLAVIDGRRAEAQLMKRIRDDLATHLGGRPSKTQELLIQRVAVLLLRIELMDRKSMADMSEKNTREYLCWVNAASRLLRQLGLQGVPERPRTLAEIMAETPPAAAHMASREAA